MFKQILALLMIVVVVKSQNNNTNVRTDDYINLNRRQYANNIASYDLQMATFKQNYAGQINTINIQLDMLTDGMLQNDEILNPLEVLSDDSKHCVSLYRSLIPTIASVKITINNCANTATSQVNALMNSALSTRNTLQTYCTSTFESQITSCNRTYADHGLNYTMCVTRVTSTTNTYTINNQKTFATQMDAAECSANAYIKKALDCNFSTHNRTISLTAQANTLINRCLQGLDVDCSRCNQGYSCPDVYHMPQSQVNYNNLTMINPFYGRNETSCLMLDIY